MPKEGFLSNVACTLNFIGNSFFGAAEPRQKNYFQPPKPYFRLSLFS
jgi:hypothetical protein